MPPEPPLIQPAADPLTGLDPAILGKLRAYEALLKKWQKTLNLIGPATLPEVWERHFIDSAQLAPLIPDTAKTLFDLGSGAGFPGLVIAIMRPNLEVHLVESDERKATFLRAVSRETNTPVLIHMGRIESLPIAPTPDVVTARALADLKTLLDWAAPWAAANSALTLILPKGKQAGAEVDAARAHYNFVLGEQPSLTDAAARILRLSGVTPVTP